MQTFILDDISFEPDSQNVFSRLRVEPDSPQGPQVEALLEEAQSLARPRALYRVADIEERGEDLVVIGGQTFESRVLSVNLKEVWRVFPFIATCGRELYEWAQDTEDILERYWKEGLMEMALSSATRYLKREMVERFALGKTATMNPGSLKDWPLSEQRKLFSVLGDSCAAIGVELKPTMLMVPEKSVSGIRFPTAIDFENCQLCSRRDCPGRRAPYREKLYERRYAGSNSDTKD